MKTFVLLALLSAIVLSGLVAGASSAVGEDPAVTTTEYRLHVGDTVNISVQGHPEYDKVFSVPPEGAVSFPPVGRLRLLGKTSKEVEENLTAAIIAAGELTNPDILVYVAAFAPREAFLVGPTSGVVQLDPRTKRTLLQVLAIARIQPATADFRRIKVIRTRPDGELFDFTVDLTEVVAEGRYDTTIFVQPEDTILVPAIENRAEMKNVYIMGKVNRPGKYSYIPSQGKMTLMHLVAEAGDFHQFADQGHIRILRQRRSGTQVLKLDFDEILDQSIEDPALEPNDVVYVPESFF